ncbi:hypothetical protein KSP40_PGU022470 [Platanthera guangdongensis]|uniref:Cystatin domain-containing protein n=1 Tax=Platanthera guangdongensis TaxID=2320717 RepID=A0ABR2M8F6_9ASPA
MEEIISVGPWGCQEGNAFSLQINNGRIQKLVILYEGGFKSLTINNSTKTTKHLSHVSVSSQNHQPASVTKPKIQSNIIKNSDYLQEVGAFWRKNFDDFTVEVISRSAGEICNNENHVLVSKRKHFYHSIEQDITKVVCAGGLYEFLADVSVKGGNGQEFEMAATVKIENMDNTLSFLHIGRYSCSDPYLVTGLLKCSLKFSSPPMDLYVICILLHLFSVFLSKNRSGRNLRAGST